MTRSHWAHGGPSAAARWAAERNQPRPRENEADVRDWHDGIRVYLGNGPFGGLADSATVSVPFHPGGRGYAPAELRYEVWGASDIRDGNPSFWCTNEHYFAVYKWSRRDANDGVHVHSYTYDR